MRKTKKNEVKWQQFRSLLLAITNDKGIVKIDTRDVAKRLSIPYYSRLSNLIKVGDKIFNGSSDVHINKISKVWRNKYLEFDFLNDITERNSVNELSNKNDDQLNIEFTNPSIDISPILDELKKLYRYTKESDDISKKVYFDIADKISHIYKIVEDLNNKNK